MTERVFVCDVEPQGDGGWEIWISEQPYRGVDTDAALGDWERKRVGSAYTSRRLVGNRKTRFLAEKAARTAVRRAESKASEHERADAEWRANLARQSFCVTNRDDPIASP